MTTIACSNTIGRMTVVKSNNVAPLSITLTDAFGVPQSIASFGLCLGLSNDNAVNAQFQNTFSDSIYVTPFGDAPGTVALTFLLNPWCDPNFTQSPTAIDAYLNNRLKPTSVQSTILADGTIQSTISMSVPTIVSIGGKLNLIGFIVGLSLNGTTSSGVMIQARLLMRAWPI